MEHIHSVAEYLKYLENIESIARTTYTVGCFTFYRGQADADLGTYAELI